MAALQQTLYKQLVTRVLPEAATMDEQLALAELKEGAKDLSVLLVLDDVWVDSHATPLNFIEPSSTTSAVMVTTRIRSLLGGATEVQCEVMSEAAALELLLRTGGCEHLLEAPPRAAIEAVKACGRLPLALGIAGGMVTQLADTWQEELGGLLEEVLRLVRASVNEHDGPFQALKSGAANAVQISPGNSSQLNSTVNPGNAATNLKWRSPQKAQT